MKPGLVRWVSGALSYCISKADAAKPLPRAEMKLSLVGCFVSCGVHRLVAKQDMYK